MNVRVNAMLDRFRSPPSWLTTALAAVAAVVAAGESVFYGMKVFTADGDAFDRLILGSSLAVLATGLVYLTRQPLLAVGRRLGAAMAGGLEFRMLYVPEHVWWLLLALAVSGSAFGLYKLSLGEAANWHLYLTAASLTVLAAGAVVQLVQHRWAGIISLAVGVVLMAAGALLLTAKSAQIDSYNQAMQTHKSEKRELAVEQKLLEQSLQNYLSNQQRSQLSRLVFPDAPSFLTARTFFHRSNLFAQTPGKGKQAYEEICRSLMFNSGNRYFGLTVEQQDVYELDARRAQRNLEKLIRSGQAGGAGMPNGKQGQGQGQQPGEPRDPGREPNPGSGRMPRNTL
jgi:hypothetical protein